ncbi:MAG: LysM peptidoglycan-binding domain-containing protein [Aggregatilineales bacterium]
MRRRFVLAFVVALLLALTAAAAAQGGVVHTVQPGKTLRIIAARYGTTVQVIASANGIYNVNRTHAGQQLFIPVVTSPAGSALRGTTVYIVEQGDTLAAIARRFGTTVSAISAVNGIANPNLIFVGQRLVIPIQ